MNILISKIRINGGTQNRVQIDNNTVREYADAITEGASFPPITVFFDGADYWLADGFHRYHAHNSIGALDIDADVVNGTQRDAILHSVGVNATHGLKRTNSDKRKSVETLLNDTEWSKWSDNAIAKKCVVSNHLVAEIRKSYLGEFQDINKESFFDQPQDKKRTVERNGKTYEQDTSNIGKSQQQNQQQDIEEKEPELSQEDVYGDFDPIAELEAANKEIERLTKIIESDDSLSAANKENKRLTELCRVLEERMRGFQSSENEAKRAAQMWKNKFDKLERQVKAAGLEDF